MMRSSCAATIVLLVTLPVVFGQRRDNKALPAMPISNHRAIVRKGEATFTFPITPHREYDWGERGMWGVWLIKIRNNSRDYECGYFIDNPIGGALAGTEGTLKELLSTGYSQCMRVSKNSASNVNDVSVKALLSDKQDKIMIIVSGGKGLELLFSSRPQNVTFVESKTLAGRSPLPARRQNSDHVTQVPVTYSQ